MKKITFVIIGVVLMLPGAPLAQYPAEEKGFIDAGHDTGNDESRTKHWM